MKVILVLTIALAILPATAAFADYAKGLEATANGNYEIALQEWEPLAKRGNAAGQNGLGWLYLRGFGVKQDYEIALELFTLSADQGFAKAHSNLGFMYRRGNRYVNAFAQYEMGWMYAHGEGVPQDYLAAFRLYQLAAENGHNEARNAVGLLYATGEGVKQDFTRAHMWWSIAVSQGYAEAMESLNMVEDRMTPVEISEAEKLARECTEKDYRDC